MIDKKNTDYRFVMSTRNIYKISEFEVVEFDGVSLKLQGDTICGLKFILITNSNKQLYFYANKTIQECFRMNYNYHLDLHRFNINQKTIWTQTSEHSICNWYYSREISSSRKNINLWNKFRVDGSCRLQNLADVPIMLEKKQGRKIYVR